MGRSPCCSKVGLLRGPWTSKEDALLIRYILDHGEGQWRSLPKKAGLLRCGKSCRLRWMNYLRPDIKRGNITSDEDEIIIKMHALLGNRWSLIAGRLPGRTDNEIKNYWNTHLSRKLKSQGIDPNTHKRIPPHTFPQTPKKRIRNSRKGNTRAGYGYNKYKSKSKTHVVAESEKIKIHNPKPVRLITTSTCTPFSLKIKKGRGDDQQITATETLNRGDGDGHGVLDIEINGASLFNDNLVSGSSFGFESHVPPFNESALDQIYEEYLQLLETQNN